MQHRYPSVWTRNDGNGEAIYWPHPFGFSTAILCAAPEPIDLEWTFGNGAGDEIALDVAGQYSIIASLEDVRVEKKFSVE